MWVLNINCFFLFELTFYKDSKIQYTTMHIYVYIHITQRREATDSLFIQIICFGFFPAKPLLEFPAGQWQYTPSCHYLCTEGQTKCLVGLQRHKIGSFFSIRRTQLHLNKPTPSERLAPAENAAQPQTPKLNRSRKFRSHQHTVKNSLSYSSVYAHAGK